MIDTVKKALDKSKITPAMYCNPSKVYTVPLTKENMFFQKPNSSFTIFIVRFKNSVGVNDSFLVLIVGHYYH